MSKVPCGGFELGDSLVVNDGKLDLAPGAGGGLPTGEAPYQQLVTDADGNAKWEDRLAYVGKEEQEIFSQENIEFNGKEYQTASPFGEFTIGEKYAVVFDGVTYENLIAFDDNGLNAIGSPYSSISDDIPFSISTVSVHSGFMILISALTSENTHSVTILGPVEVAHKIPQQYLPDVTKLVMLSSTSGSAKKFEITVDDTGTLSATEITSGDVPR